MSIEIKQIEGIWTVKVQECFAFSKDEYQKALDTTKFLMDTKLNHGDLIQRLQQNTPYGKSQSAMKVVHFLKSNNIQSIEDLEKYLNSHNVTEIQK